MTSGISLFGISFKTLKTSRTNVFHGCIKLIKPISIKYTSFCKLYLLPQVKSENARCSDQPTLFAVIRNNTFLFDNLNTWTFKMLLILDEGNNSFQKCSIIFYYYPKYFTQHMLIKQYKYPLQSCPIIFFQLVLLITFLYLAVVFLPF